MICWNERSALAARPKLPDMNSKQQRNGLLWGSWLGFKCSQPNASSADAISVTIQTETLAMRSIASSALSMISMGGVGIAANNSMACSMSELPATSRWSAPQ